MHDIDECDELYLSFPHLSKRLKSTLGSRHRIFAQQRGSPDNGRPRLLGSLHCSVSMHGATQPLVFAQKLAAFRWKISSHRRVQKIFSDRVTKTESCSAVCQRSQCRSTRSHLPDSCCSYLRKAFISAADDFMKFFSFGIPASIV